MKKLTLTLAIVSALFASGCKQLGNVSDSQISTGVAIGTTAGLRYGIQDAAKRTLVADYINVCASALRSLTGTPPPTPADLTALLNKAVPDSIRSQNPELIAFVAPLVVTAYQFAYDKYGSGADAAKLYGVLNSIAVGLETGAAPYITKK